MDLDDEEEEDNTPAANKSEMSTALDSFYASLGIDEGSSSPSVAAGPAGGSAAAAAAGPSGGSSRFSSRSASPCGSPSPYNEGSDKERKKKKVSFYEYIK